MNCNSEMLDARTVAAAIERDGFWVGSPLIDPGTCREMADIYECDQAFRSTISMARFGFGQGEYRYFARPLPPLVEQLRTQVYERLAPIANAWNVRYGNAADWPADHSALVARCASAGQCRPTPLLLRYGPGDYNCLHQDLYGEIHFPLQAIVVLDRPGDDFDGGELVLVERRPRRQSTPRIVPLIQGAIALIPVKERPIEGVRGTARVQVHHGVSVVRRGLRRTLGLIFHDAA